MRDGWEYKKLGEVATIAAGQGAPQGNDNYCQNGTPFIKAGNLEGLIKGVQESEIQKVSEEVAQRYRLKRYRAGSVLFAKSGMSCMKGLVYTLKNDCYVVSHLAIITPKNINSSFLNYYFQINKPNKLIKDSAYPSISLKDIDNLSVLIPPLAEQERIVAELDLLSSIIEKKKAQLKEYDQLAQSIFYDMFGNPVTNEKGWEVKKLGEVCENKRAILRASNYFKPNEQINYIDISSIDNGQNKITSTTPYLFEDAPSRAQQIVKEGDILISLVRPNLKNIAIVIEKDHPVVASSGFCVLRTKADTNNIYVFYVVRGDSFTNYLLGRVQGANYPAVREDDVKNYFISLPPLSLQQQFADKIEAIEKQKKLIKQSIAETETLFDSRMDYYFN